MPAIKRNASQRLARSTADDEPDGEEPSSSTQKSSQSSSQYNQLTADIQEQLVNDSVHFLLIAHQRGLPIKRSDIIKNVLKQHSKTFPFVISKVTDVLKKVFGICLVEVADKKGVYMLINNLDFKMPETDVPLQLWSDTESAHQGLLMIILVVIFMSGNVVQESLLWQFLKKLGLDAESDYPHPLFGNIKKLLTQEFVRKLYIEHKLVPGSEPPVYEYRFGPRASLETSKKEMLEFVCKLYKDMSPQLWASQYQDAMANTEHAH